MSLYRQFFYFLWYLALSHYIPLLGVSISFFFPCLHGVYMVAFHNDALVTLVLLLCPTQVTLCFLSVQDMLAQVIYAFSLLRICSTYVLLSSCSHYVPLVNSLRGIKPLRRGQCCVM